MKNYLRVSIVALVCSIFLFSCTPDEIAEEVKENVENTEEQAINGKGVVTDTPTSDED